MSTTTPDTTISEPLATESSDSRSGMGLFFWAVAAAFGAYFCMYGFRKPFSVATYEGVPDFLGVQYKTLLVTSQVFGYTVSKFIGIRVVSELKPHQRAMGILLLIGIAELALVGFGLVPTPWNFLMLFLNGLPLGMVFGLVMGFLEGRRQSEAMLAGLCCSFIVADGVVKAAGAYLLEAGVSQFWMPAATGMVFALPLIGFVWALSKIPAPNRRDVEARSERGAMDKSQRWGFFRKYALGLSLIGALYLLVTIIRSIRSDFATELWKGLGVASPPAIFFATSETYVGLGVALAFATLVWIRNNRVAFYASMLMGLAGFALGLAALVGLKVGLLDPFTFMVTLGIALYLPYVAVHVCVFERLLAVTRDRGNIGFLMYLVDSFGYLGYVAVMLGKSALKSRGGILDLFLATSWLVMSLGILAMLASMIYFVRHPALKHAPVAPRNP